MDIAVKYVTVLTGFWVVLRECQYVNYVTSNGGKSDE
jgi:hypothetical protein